MVNDLRSVFVKEQKRYTKKQLIKLFGMKSADTSALIKTLKAYGVLKTVANNIIQQEETNLLEDDVEIVEDENDDAKYLYVFTFVGVIALSGIVLKCFPKYLFSDPQPIKELKKVLKVIDRFNKKEHIIKFQNDHGDESNFNKLAVMLYLLNDYYEFGVYSNSQEILESNGGGEIHWDKTINATFAFISNNRPFYPDLLTKRRIDDEFNFFRRLHTVILTMCSKELESSGLIHLFDILAVDLSDKTLDDFGDTEYILNQIEKEVNVQFNTRKQLLLKTMYSYIANEGGINSVREFNFYGTNSFHVIWEKITAEIIGNHLETPLDKVIQLSDNYKQYSNSTLKSLIEKPKWTPHDKSVIHESEKTLIPDLIRIRHTNNEYQFLIFDAKYYNLKLDSKGVNGQPGIESVTKQYLYQLAYKDFLNEHKIRIIKNCFLFPTEKEGIIDVGSAKMEMLSNLGLEDIQLRLLSADLVFDYYLQGKSLSIEELRLLE